MNTELSNIALYRPTDAVSSEKPVVSTAKITDVDQSKATPETAATTQQEKPQELAIVNDEELQESVSRINEFIQVVQRDLEFSIDEATGRQVITVLDRSSDEVIRQIPTEAVLAIAENIETLKGILFSAEA